MSQLNTQPKLEDSEDSRVTKDAAIAFLRLHPNNFTKCAEVLGIAHAKLMSVRNLYLAEFHAVEEAFLDEIEELCILDATGKLPAEKEDFQFSKGFKFLERMRAHKYGPKSQVKHLSTEAKVPKPNGKGDELLEQHAREKGITLPTGNWTEQ